MTTAWRDRVVAAILAILIECCLYFAAGIDGGLKGASIVPAIVLWLHVPAFLLAGLLFFWVPEALLVVIGFVFHMGLIYVLARAALKMVLIFLDMRRQLKAQPM